MIVAYPLESLTIEEATEKQFKLVDSITQYFNGTEILTLGDLGVVPRLNKPLVTQKAEDVISHFFQQQDAMLVRGSGTNAIRLALHSVLRAGEKLLVHDAPIYSTTKTSIDMLAIELIEANFNDYEQTATVIKKEKPKAILVQLTRQKLDDSYDYVALIKQLKADYPQIPIITDDNYAVMKVSEIGVECGADLSCFSMFKLLGPEGIGCVVGKEKYIEKLKKENYSGGLQVQGHEALGALRGMVYAPVSLAISAQQSEALAQRLNTGEITQVKQATIVNAQSKVVIVEFKEPIAEKILKLAPQFGAARNPVGAESKYEIAPMIYRISGTFREAYPEMAQNCIRINPMRSSAQTIINILKKVIEIID